MKKKNNNSTSKTQQARDYFNRAHKAIARLLRAGKHYLNSGIAYLNEGNIYGENEEDYFSHA